MVAATAVGARKAPVPLRPIFDAFAKEAQLSPWTVKRWTPVMDRLAAHLGHDDAAAISRTDIVAWKDALLDGDMSNVTVRDERDELIHARLEGSVRFRFGVRRIICPRATKTGKGHPPA